MRVKVRGGSLYVSLVIGVTWNSAGDDNVAGAVHQPAHVHGCGRAERRRLAVVAHWGSRFWRTASQLTDAQTLG